MEVACAQSRHMVTCKLNFASIFISIVTLLPLLPPLCCLLALPSVQCFGSGLATSSTIGRHPESGAMQEFQVSSVSSLPLCGLWSA
ncbi:hypothetical protein EV421DRAFT_1833399 [Armillaria borealis]|uniref:Uncharacterized protein n=1 Tax=Armillaria borealis TaxID=47425 RepID=A0AA39MJH0_9AGAR|nr:hypothetical protein EV421DRAFT_1833399 [Armillaria borealis]